MNEKQTIYIVTEGIYSDYHIVAVFSTMANAELFVEKATRREYDNYRVEEYELDLLEQQIHERLQPYFVMMDRKGEFEAWIDIEAFASMRALEFGKYKLRGHVLAESEEHAIKIASEKRAQLIATNQW